MTTAKFDYEVQMKRADNDAAATKLALQEVKEAAKARNKKPNIGDVLFGWFKRN